MNHVISLVAKRKLQPVCAGTDNNGNLMWNLIPMTEWQMNSVRGLMRDSLIRRAALDLCAWDKEDING